MKYIIFGLMIFILLACNSQGFYSEMKKNKSVYKNFFKYEGNIENIKLLNNDLDQSKEIIIIGSNIYPQSFSFIFDSTNNSYYYIEKNVFEKNVIFKKLKEGDLKNDEIDYDYFIFILNYILNNKTDELLDISEKAFDDKSGVYSVVKIINIEKNIYKEFSFKSFLTYEGSPVMTKEEYLKAMDFE